MLRKTTALSFLLVMTLLVILKHPVLGYCLCLDKYFTGGCSCAMEKPVAKTDTEATHLGCCASCETDQQEQVPGKQPSPCDDCTKHLSIDVGDFVWQCPDDIPSNPETPAAPVAYDQRELHQLHDVAQATMPIRGDPPPGMHSGNTPIYLRHGVLRL